MNSLHKSNSQMEENKLKLKYSRISTQQYVNAVEENLTQAQDRFLMRLYDIHMATYGEKQNPLKEPLRSQIITDFSLPNLNTQQLIDAWNSYISVHEYEQLGKEAAAVQLSYVD